MPAQRRVALMFELEWPHKRHTDTFAGTQQFALEQGWETIVDEFAYENLPQRRSAELPYDGIIGRIPQRLAERAARLGLPVVNVWFSSPVWRQLPGVFPEYETGGQLRAEHLLERGLRQFATLSREDRAAKIETAVFEKVVGEAGFPCAGIKLPLHPTRNYATWEKSQRLIEQWMDQWELPIGVFVSVDEVGRLLAQMCQRRGWRVPRDVAIIAGWNEETICLQPRPALTSLEPGYQRVGYQAAQLLEQLMNQRDAQAKPSQSPRRGARKLDLSPFSHPPRHIFVPPQGLVVRESTDFFAVDDELVAAALQFIAAHSHEQIGQDDVSRAVSAETRTLQSRFRKVLDRPIATVIRQVRIERAKRELTQSDRSLQQIARAVGFGTAAQMRKVFCRELGATPSEYRQQRLLERGD